MSDSFTTTPTLSSLALLDATTAWIAAAADDPGRRLAGALPPTLDFRPWAELLRAMHRAALPETQIGGSLLLGADGLEIGTEMAWRARYAPIVEGKRFVGTVHVHPKGAPETFDAADLSGFLRSDYPGFLDLLVTAESASALVRTRRFLYIAGDRVDRDPLLLEGDHPGLRRDPAPRGPAEGARERHAAVRTVCHLYEMVLYQGPLDAPLPVVFRPG
jgi:hypothetical protein